MRTLNRGIMPKEAGMEKIGYTILVLAAILWLGIVLWGSAIDFWPGGLLGFLIIGGCGFLFVKALADRLSNKEDYHYSKNVDQ